MALQPHQQQHDAPCNRKLRRLEALCALKGMLHFAHMYERDPCCTHVRASVHAQANAASTCDRTGARIAT
eukprot:6756270-Prymnesium_polylepis.1